MMFGVAAIAVALGAACAQREPEVVPVPAPVEAVAPAPAPIVVTAQPVKKAAKAAIKNTPSVAEAKAYAKAVDNASRANCLRIAATMKGDWYVRNNTLQPEGRNVRSLSAEECQILTGK